MIRRRQIIGPDKDAALLHDTSHFNAHEDDTMFPMTQKIVIGASDYRDMYVSEYFDKRTRSGESTITHKITVRGNYNSAMAYIRKSYAAYKMFSSGTQRVIVEDANALIEVESNHNTIDFLIHSTFETTDALKIEILKEFEEILICVRWVYNSHGHDVSIPLDASLAPVDEMYPWLNGESLESYFKRYYESSASILILIGPPGTGKTSFIRGYLLATQSSAMVTYDEKILSSDSIFSGFVESEANAFILEDADLFLSSRKDGNDMMHRFLNVGDGLVTVRGKKIIFSTNLPSTKDIDAALLRPGRCFDIINFEELNKDQANALSKKLSLDFVAAEDTTYSVADVFATTRNTHLTSPTRRFGFV